MIKGVPFQTKARTVDHLGREQIADCPTAISELWKNAYDAYARIVELNIYDGEEPVATIVDDGHGMNREEFINRWLVVGTESKATTEITPSADRNNLAVRQRQGQKGIGRLSCANLGPVLLFVSKRKNSPFVVALVDWRLFENPFINLSDIEIPVMEFEEKLHLLELIPDLVESLSQNVTGGSNAERAQRLRLAWKSYDNIYQQEIEAESNNKLRAPSLDIISTANRLNLDNRHLEQWPVWNGESDQGTALIISQINYDLRAQLDEKISDLAARTSRDKFFETLSSFVDPFVDPSRQQFAMNDIQFSYLVRAWQGQHSRIVVGSDKQFDRRLLDEMEHRIEGKIGSDGIFRGRVRAFGSWSSDDCIIEPPNDLIIPLRADSTVGPFEIYIASMEFLAVNSSHTPMDWQRYSELAVKYAGLMLFRDGLRVMPFGRTDNDFFGIEERRSKNAGREFWNHRQMFGRLAITRISNPNLKDKAGREGLLDNRAAKILKALVENLLQLSARRYFGRASQLRDEFLPQIQNRNKRERAAEARNKLRKRQRSEFRTKLQSQSKELPAFAQQVRNFSQSLAISSEPQIVEIQSKFEQFRERFEQFGLPGAPKDLGSLEEPYADYKSLMRSTNDSLVKLGEDIERQIELVNPTKPRELLDKQLSRNAAQIHQRIQSWKRSIDTLQKEEFTRIRELIEKRNKLFHAEALPLLSRFDSGEANFSEVSKLMETLRHRLDSENAEIFLPYIGALQSLKESIDLEHLATFGMEELSDLRVELERLNSLAQLGIAVEIVGHELQSYDDIIGSGLRQLPDNTRSSKAVKDIELGYEGLTDQLRFLSPLRLAGQKIQKWITGAEIADYVFDFFRITLAKNSIEFTATQEFKKVRIFDQPSRLYLVFINLINNSIYWLAFSKQPDRKILLDIVGEEVFVSDNGPGVDEEDVNSLFGLFFTKKARGGRGVGLFLSRANLSAGGHSIRYETTTSSKLLSGANFVIKFRGAEFDGE